MILRLGHPALDYYPPEELIQKLTRSWFAVSGTRTAAQGAYATVTLVLMAVFFAMLQRRWPGRRGWNGSIFGGMLGLLWALGFLSNSPFFGTTLGAELLNGILDLTPQVLGGWLIGLAIGQDVPGPEHRSGKPWLAIFPIACGFVAVYSLGAVLLQAPLGRAAVLLPPPATAFQYITLSMLGLWAGVMYVILRPALPSGSPWVNAAIFAFGVFGHSWIWFNIYWVIEFGGVLLPSFLIGFLGVLGVFIGASAYELAAGARNSGEYSYRG